MPPVGKGMKENGPYARLIPGVFERHDIMRVAIDGLGKFARRE